jgi:hypothetical protein
MEWGLTILNFIILFPPKLVFALLSTVNSIHQKCPFENRLRNYFEHKKPFGKAGFEGGEAKSLKWGMNHPYPHKLQGANWPYINALRRPSKHIIFNWPGCHFSFAIISCQLPSFLP